MNTHENLGKDDVENDGPIHLLVAVPEKPPVLAGRILADALSEQGTKAAHSAIGARPQHE